MAKKNNLLDQQLFQASARSGTRVMGRRPSSASCCPALGDLECAENNKQTKYKAMKVRGAAKTTNYAKQQKPVQVGDSNGCKLLQALHRPLLPHLEQHLGVVEVIRCSSKAMQ